MIVSAARVAHQLQSAARHLQSGDLRNARGLLEGLLAVQPGLPDAYWLLGGVLMRSGDFAHAERAVATAIQLAPANPSAHALLGEILACQGRMADAEHASRQALALAPGHPNAVSLLLRVLQAQARHIEVWRYADTLIARGLVSPDIWLARAQALLFLKRIPEAADSFRKAMALAPDDARVRLGMVGAQIEAGEPAAAEEGIRELIKSGADGAEARYALARSLLAQHRYDEAEVELRKATAARPDFNAAQTNLVELVWMRTGDSAAAAAGLEEALHAQPGNVELRILKANLLEWAGQQENAVAEIEACLAQDSSNIMLNIAAARATLERAPERALRYAKQAFRQAASDPAALSAYAYALLANNRAEEAIRITAQMLLANPNDAEAVALRASAWRLLGDPRYGALYDYPTFVRAGTIDTPPGWASLADYLRDLTVALDKRHVMHAHPIGQSLRHGTQVNLSMDRFDDPAIQAFRQAIDGPIRRYMLAIGSGTDVLRARNARDYKIAGIWSVRLRANGHHVNHYHPEGWLSSACYIDLPETLGASDHEGWLKFGESGIPTQPLLGAEYFVKPEPGLLVLFPSWMWHGTVPFSGGEHDRRLTIAFDVVPV